MYLFDFLMILDVWD
uniref:Uncharacterized protein n=1 Tax=Rhizophora mucronata TaxID=61149 RepID=A0A2P2QVQ1_RHIMU